MKSIYMFLLCFVVGLTSVTNLRAANDPVILNCPANTTVSPCLAQAELDAAFVSFLNSFSFTGGCNAEGTFNGTPMVPDRCGGSVSISYVVNSECGPDVSCTRIFTVEDAPEIDLSCPADSTMASCLETDELFIAFNTFIESFSFSGGCNAYDSFLGVPEAPDICGGSVQVTYLVLNDCELTLSCTSNFTVNNSPEILLNCPGNTEVSICLDDDEITNAFNNFLNSFSFSGGCNAMASFDGTPTVTDRCDGSVSVTYAVESECGPEVSCTNTFTINNDSPQLVLTCPDNTTIAACSDGILDAFNTFLESFSFSGGCASTYDSFEDYNIDMLNSCGGSITVTYVVQSDCNSETCSSLFSVEESTAVEFFCPDFYRGECQSQEEIDLAFSEFLSSFTFSGGCNAVSSFIGSPVAPDFCGGSIDVSYQVESDCDITKTCQGSFTVGQAPEIDLNCPESVTVNCQDNDGIISELNSFLNSFSFTGGCNAVSSFDEDYLNSPLEGSIDVVFRVESDCGEYSCAILFNINRVKWAGENKFSCGEEGVEIGTSCAIENSNDVCYVWEPSEGLSCTDCPNPIANPKYTTTYKVKVIANDLSWVEHDYVTVNLSFGEMKFNPPYLRSGSDQKVEASLLKVNSSNISWSIIDNALGCTITSQGATALIQPGNAFGTITVQAENLDLPGCVVKESLDINAGVKDVEARDIENEGRIARNGDTLYIFSPIVAIEAIPNEGGFDEETPDWKQDNYGSKKLAKGQSSGIISESIPIIPWTERTSQYIAGDASVNFEPKVTVIRRRDNDKTTISREIQVFDFINSANTFLKNTRFNNPVKMGEIEMKINLWSNNYTTEDVGKYRDPGYANKVKDSINCGFEVTGKIYHPAVTRNFSFYNVQFMSELYGSASGEFNYALLAEYDPSKDESARYGGYSTAEIIIKLGLTAGITGSLLFDVFAEAKASAEIRLRSRYDEGKLYGQFQIPPAVAELNYGVKLKTDPAVRRRFQFGEFSGSSTLKAFSGFVWPTPEAVMYDIND